jgi:hypothetical protein
MNVPTNQNQKYQTFKIVFFAYLFLGQQGFMPKKYF